MPRCSLFCVRFLSFIPYYLFGYICHFLIKNFYQCVVPGLLPSLLVIPRFEKFAPFGSTQSEFVIFLFIMGRNTWRFPENFIS